MDTPETRYARRGDLHIGYQVWGNAEVDILDFGSGTYISIDEAGELPQWHRFTDRLASSGRVIRFDPTGVGLSDTPVDYADLTLQAWADDALAVMDAVGSARAIVLAAASSVLSAIVFAAQHPDRVVSLVIVNGSSRYQEAVDYPIGIPSVLMKEFREGLDPDSGGPVKEELEDLRLFAPSAADDPEFQRWWSRASKRGAAPATAAVLSMMTTEADVRHHLAAIEAPTLVIHRDEALAPGLEHGRYIADHLGNARFISMPGSDIIPYVGDSDGLMDEIQEFIVGDRYQPGPERVLATMLYTDIVDSTATAVRLGDYRWTQVLIEHDALIRRQLDRFGGQLVNDTGDGLLATFDGPARAIRCALTLRDGAERLGIQIRAGLHCGEIERRGPDVGGIAVHIAARVADQAQGGEVLVSGVVVELVEGSGIEFDDHGHHELRGVSQSRQLWRVVRG
jgi:class 3 adenylate cyclase/pimeloyl-ACP methyl ester carboxylesterase